LQITQKNFYKKFLGRAGEVKACEFLKDKGLKILERNHKTKLGEVDIICEDDGYIIFVEVKTRTDNTYGNPSEAVDFRKREKYFRLAEEYMMKNKLYDKSCRFDVVEIENGQINHIENAFYRWKTLAKI